MKIVITVLLLFISSAAYSQVVDIESKRIRSAEDGWFGEAALDILLLKDVNTVFASSGKIQLQMKKDRSLLLFLTDFGFIKAGDKKFENNGFQHVRYNYKVTPEFLRWEAFGQAQFNKVRDIKLRGLLGTGPRIKLYDTDAFRLYAASLYMYEYEERQSEPLIERHHRLSSYISFGADIGKADLSATIYYQPLFRDLDDYRIALSTELSFELFKELNFVTKYSLLYDTVPPPGIPNTAYAISQGVELEL
jgi:hypothetical protein